MFATAVTLAIMSLALRALADLATHDGAKIVDALRGRSPVAPPGPDRPIAVRFSPPPVAPAWRQDLRAAA